LGRLGAPGILGPVKPQDATDDQYRQRNIGIPAEQHVIKEFVHPALLHPFLTELMASRAAFSLATTPVAPPSCIGAEKSTGASSRSWSTDLRSLWRMRSCNSATAAGSGWTAAISRRP